MNRIVNRGSAPGRRIGGFTLVELLIAMMVIAVLASVAFPSFMQSVRKSKRSDATTMMTQAAGNLERFFAANGTYTTVLNDIGMDAVSDKGYYKLVIQAGPTGIASSYIITAKAMAGTMQSKDTGCTALQIDSLGVQTPDPATSDCW